MAEAGKADILKAEVGFKISLGMNPCLAVVGCGQWGKNLVRTLYHLGALRALCDNLPEEELSDLYGVPFLSFEEILSNADIQGIVLAVPAPLHTSLGLRALKAGKHVLIEKPMALSSADVQSLIDEAQRQKRVLMGGHLLRYHPAFLILQDWVSKGKLGRLLFIDAYRQTFGRVCFPEKNVFWSLSPHDISLILALMKALPCHVEVISDAFYTTDDQGVAHLSFDSGVKARVITSWLYPKKEQRLVVVGEQGALIFDDTAQHKLTYFDSTMAGPLPQLCAGTAYPIPYEDKQPLSVECTQFLLAIQNNLPVPTDGLESLHVIQVLEAIDRAMLQKKGACL